MENILNEGYILLEIFIQSSISELLIYEQVSTYWQSIVNIDSIWKHFCKRDKKINFKANSLTWRELYRVDLKKWNVCLHLAQSDEEFEKVALTLVVCLIY